MVQVIDGLDLYRALSDLARRYQFRNKDEVCCYGLTVSQCYALEALAQKGVLASSDLSIRLGLDLSTTTRLVDQLLRKKLAVRRNGSKDRRVHEVVITEAGQRLIRRIESDLAGLLSHAICDFPAAVQRTLPQVLKRIAAALDAKTTAFIPVEQIRKLER